MSRVRKPYIAGNWKMNLDRPRALDLIKTIKGRLGVVHQENSLDPDLSVEQNLAVYASYFGIRSSEARRLTENACAVPLVLCREHLQTRDRDDPRTAAARGEHPCASSRWPRWPTRWPGSQAARAASAGRSRSSWLARGPPSRSPTARAPRVRPRRSRPSRSSAAAPWRCAATWPTARPSTRQWRR